MTTNQSDSIYFSKLAEMNKLHYLDIKLITNKL